MFGQRRGPGRGVVRATVGLLGVLAAVALAVPASATPETDAADAINATYGASGGPTGSLGPEQGDVYPVGVGFARNYAGGVIFFTPTTGAKSMGGAILAKYDSLGGAAASDIGFPSENEATGLFSPDSRYSTFSAPDKPVIYWTPATGAWLVRGAMNAAWDKLGSSSGPLGAPVEDARYNGSVVAQRFTGGEVSWDLATGAFTTVPPELAGQLADVAVPKLEPNIAINAVWQGAGGAGGPLGAKNGDLYPVGEGGIGQDFAGGAVFFSDKTGANVVTGAILEKYLSMGGPGGGLGFPIASEADGAVPGSRISSFAADDKPVIFWTPENGPVVVRGAMRTAWDKVGGPTGQLGVPVSDQTKDGDVITQVFAGGQISWNSQTDAFTTQPPELAEQLGGLEVPVTTEPAAPTSVTALPSAGPATADRFNWNWWWFAVPVFVLLAALVGALLWRRERKPKSADDSEVEVDDDGLAAPKSGRRQWRAGSGSAPAGTAVLDPDAPPDEQGRHEVGAKLTGWGEGQDDIDTDSFKKIDEPGPARHSADVEDAPTTSIPRKTYSYESVPMFEPWRPQEDPAPPPEAAPDTADDGPYDGDYDDDESFEDEPGQESVLQGAHLPLADRNRAPRGYPIKGDANSGHYYLPDNPLYGSAEAEIWFDTEESARASGFEKDR